ncbi:MAG: hypothetical protein QOF36_2571 [Microbacteriaceae bacterium]|jgi:hypothetical protein|nr:hypothetical protein [Microbacteriaceae bacterium]
MVHVIPRSEGITVIGAPRHYLVLGPKKADHPTIGAICLACGQMFEEGQYTTMIALGPGTDPQAKLACLAGKTYPAQGLELHYTCVTGMLPEDAEKPKPAPTSDGSTPVILPGQTTLEDLGEDGDLFDRFRP